MNQLTILVRSFKHDTDSCTEHALVNECSLCIILVLLLCGVDIHLHVAQSYTSSPDSDSVLCL